MSKTSFYYSESPYRHTLQVLYRALSANEALVKFIGSAQTGKSALCEKLAKFMQHKGYRVVYFSYALDSPEMLRAMLARQLDVPNSSNFARTLEDVPFDDDGKPLILIFDDAHQLNPITLLEIYRLVQIQTGVIRKLNIVLCGEPILEQTLKRQPELQSLLMHVSHNISLVAMNKAELEQFLYAYLAREGKLDVKLDGPALGYFYKLTSGLPGPALDFARELLAAIPDEAASIVISKAQLGEILKQLQSPEQDYRRPYSAPARPSKWGMLGPIAIVVIIASIAMLYQQLTVSGVDNLIKEPANTGIGDAGDSPFVAPGADSGSTASVTVPSLAAPSLAEPAIVDGSIGVDVGENDSADVVSVDEIAINSEVTVASTNTGSEPQSVAPEPSVPVTDSDLVLVTAAERGIYSADIVEPIFTDVDNDIIAIAASTTLADNGTTVDSTLVPTLDSTRDSSLSSTLGLSQGAAAETSPETIPETSPETIPETSPETIAEAIEETSDERIQLREEATEVAIEEATEETTEETNEATPVEASVPDFIADAVSDNVDPTPASDAPDLSGEEYARQSVQYWITAWQSQDLEGYFAAYHPEYEPRYHDSFAIWEQDRTRVIGNAASIKLNLRELAVVSATQDTIEVQFWLDYRSPSYADSTLKKLVLAAQENRWLILEEINLQVVRL